ncbi:MAG: type I secretion system permease/ATPase [Alphaproteobacteria bacterium]|nr:type I secretion system permease/ATPase [Alphaproteobacteria bacterium]
MKLGEWAGLDSGCRDNDDVLDCLAHLALLYDRPSSPTIIKAGLALAEDGRLPFHQAQSALDQLGMGAEMVVRPLAKWRKKHLPAMLRLANGRAVVLLDIEGDQVKLYIPGRAETLWTGQDALTDIFDGHAVAVWPDHRKERESELSWDLRAQRHWFWQEVWRVRKSFGYVIAAAAIINLLAFAMPLFTMNVYDRVIPNRATSSLWVLAIGVFFAFGMEFALRLARARLIDETGRKLDARLSQKLFEKVLNIPLASRKGSTGAFVRRVSEFEQVRDFFASTTVVLIVDLFFLFFFIALIALITGWLALVPVVAMIIMGTAGFTLQKAMGRAALDAQADAGLQHTVLVEAVGGLETLKACRAEGRMLGRWQRYAEMSAQTQERLRRLTAISVNLASLCQQATSISLVIGGFYLFNAGVISMGAIIAVVMLAGRSLAPVGQFAFLFTRARQAFTTLEGLQGMMQQNDERDSGARSILPEIRNGDIAMEHIAFNYPDTSLPALNDISLRITRGERIGIIGRVASGKSTFGRVLCGLYQPTDGSMRIDGLDSGQYHAHEIRSAFRYVGQDSMLFSGSIRDNLLLGAQESDDARLIEALRKSGAGNFFAGDADGFDMQVGERGSRLSGGQRSFLVLARALVEPSRLLFLDEPTGAMDSGTEQMFIDHLRKSLNPQQTLVVSTHRNAMLSLVQRLIVIDGGRIVADGPRDEILKSLAGKAIGT